MSPVFSGPIVSGPMAGRMLRETQQRVSLAVKRPDAPSPVDAEYEAPALSLSQVQYVWSGDVETGVGAWRAK